MSVNTAPDATELVMDSAPGFVSLLETTYAQRIAGTFDNQPTWDNPTPVFDNRPTWDNWKKK